MESTGNFLSGHIQGTILKKLSGNEEKCFRAIMQDIEVRDLVPQFKNLLNTNGESMVMLEYASSLNFCHSF